MKFSLKLFIPLLLGCILFLVMLNMQSAPVVFQHLFGSRNKFGMTDSATLTRPVVTVINPVRGPQLGLEQVHLLDSLKSQWQVTKEAGVHATWLWQYSAMEDTTLTDLANKEMQDQEFGIFLEIDRNLSEKAGVLYRGYGPWYFSDGLLLLSYDKEERRKLIDTVFAKFKDTFGYYPKTVGAWWVGADSLQYMQERYGIIASLHVADQYDLDVYSVWGHPWSVPYLMSKDNASIPADSVDKSLGIVMMQWAPRDPTAGYGNLPSHSTYSMQDYALKQYDLSYVDYLFSIFLKGPGDQMVIGLESGFPPQGYKSDYKDKLTKITNLQKEQKIAILTAGDFAESFLAREKVFGQTAYFLSQGYESEDQSFWYQSGSFRAGIEKIGDEVFLVDVRDYVNKKTEDFDVLPNSQGYLRVAAPAVIDSARTSSEKVLLGKTNKQIRVQKENDKIIVTDDDIQFARFTDNTIVTPQNTFVFQEQTRPLKVFILLFSILLLYVLALLLVDKDKKNVYLHGAILFGALLIARPFLNLGNLFDMTFFIDPKTAFVLPILRFIPGDISWSLFIVFQILPILVLLLLHYLFVVKNKLVAVYGIGVFVFLLFYTHVPSPIVTEFITRKKLAVIGMIGIYVLFALLVFMYLWLKKKRKYLRTAGLLLFAGLVLVVSSVFLSWQKYVVTPFEMKSLKVIAASRQDVYFIQPKQLPVYRAVEPLLFADYKYGESLTKTHWQTVMRPEGGVLAFDSLENKVVFVPKYLGADLYPEEIAKYKLKKIFDNTQIQLYSL